MARTDPMRETQVNPLLRLHLLLYGRYKWAITLGVVLAASAAAAAWKLTPPKYQVVGYVRVKPYIPPVLGPNDQNGMLPSFDTFVSLQVSLLESQRVLDQASLNHEWEALGKESPRWGKKIPADGLTVDHPKGSELVTVAYTDRDPNVASVAVKSVLQAYQATSGNPDERLQILIDLRANLTNQKHSIGEQILVLANEVGTDDLKGLYQFRLEQQNKLESELQQVALDISIAQAAAGGGEVPHDPAASQPAVAPPAETALDHPAAKTPALNPAVTSDASLLKPPVTMTREDVAKIDLQMREEISEESSIKLRLNQLRLRLGEHHPEVMTAQDELQVVEDQINSLLALYQERAALVESTSPGTPGSASNRLSLAELRSRETNIRNLFEKVQAETKELGQKDLKIRNLKADQDAISHKLEETAARLDQLNLEATTANRISVLSTGEMPNEPLPSKRLPLMAVMSFMGLAAGAALVAVRGAADRRVSSLLHMQKLVPSTRVLGMLPVLPDDLADPEQISLAAHCVHQIRGLLESVKTHDKGRVLAITSPSAGDGKTSLALALGLSFAASGSRTLLIDCDIVGGGLTRRLNATAHRRLGSILQRQNLLNDAQIEEAARFAAAQGKRFGEALVSLGFIKPADLERALAQQKQTSMGVLDALNGEPVAGCLATAVMEGLYILPLGDAAPDNNNQISAKALRRVIRDARAQFDFIIVDTGPLLGSLEASVAAREADEVVLAIARGAPAPLVSRTIDMLMSLGAPLGGVVFNRATPGDVAYSHYGSSGSLRSLRSSNAERSNREPRHPAGSPPRLGPVAAAVATNGTASKKAEAVPVAIGISKLAAQLNGNGKSNHH